MPSPESVIAGVMTWSDLDCTSAEGGIYKFCIGDYGECHIGKEGMADAFKVEMLVSVSKL